MSKPFEFSVLIPARDLGLREYRSIQSVASTASTKLSDITVVVDPRCLDYSWAGQIAALPSVNLVTAQPHSDSVGAILNDGLHHCRSRSILRHDADDFWIPGRENIQVPRILESGGFVVGEALQSNGQRIRRPLFPSLPSGQVWGAALIFGNPIIHPTVGFDRLAVDERPYTEGIQAEDFDLWLRAAMAGTPMTAHRGYVTIYARHAAQVSRGLRSDVVANECGPLFQALAAKYSHGTPPALEILVCRGDCPHDSSLLAAFFQDCKATLKALLVSDRRSFERYKGLLYSRIWAVAVRHRPALESAGLRGVASAFRSLPMDPTVMTRVASNALRAFTRSPYQP